MTPLRASLGRWGERVAAAYLVERGYHVLERNARTKYGEIDLVTRQGDVIVFVEVKTRRTDAFGWPEEAITSRKRNHLLAAAQAYLMSHPQLDGDWRIDVIAIRHPRKTHPPQIVHFENAVT